MKRAHSIAQGSVWQLRLFAALLAVFGQLGISGASLTLARDESSAVSHTEQSGVDLHRGHDDATCATCAALSFQATLNSVAPQIPSEEISLVGLAHRANDLLSGPQLLSNSCRAPPPEL